jgi:hypothetical protein
MRYYWLVLGILTVWRVTHLLNAEDGPWDLLVRFRRRVGTGFWGKLLDCFLCLSVWVSAPLAVLLGGRWKERLLLWPALSAGAILLERLTGKEQAAPPALYFEEPENPHVLRQEPTTVPRESDRGATGRGNGEPSES